MSRGHPGGCSGRNAQVGEGTVGPSPGGSRPQVPQARRLGERKCVADAQATGGFRESHAYTGRLPLLPAPPMIQMPLPDFRTRGNLAVRGPSPDLLDTIFQAQQRQEWYEEYARTAGIEPRSFVGSITPATQVEEAADLIRNALDFGVGQRGSTWEAAFRILADNAERLGVLVMVSGVVGSNTHRKLNVEEFQGFALASPYAPVVFVNGNDTRAAKIFTLSHELAHLWLGQSALDDADPATQSVQDAERWCSQVSAVVLVPARDLQGRFRGGLDLTSQLDELASVFKVSTLVVLRRLREVGCLSQAQFQEAYGAELERVLSFVPADARGGGATSITLSQRA